MLTFVLSWLTFVGRKYWWVNPKDRNPGYNIPFKTVEQPDADRLATVPSIERWDALPWLQLQHDFRGGCC